MNKSRLFFSVLLTLVSLQLMFSEDNRESQLPNYFETSLDSIQNLDFIAFTVEDYSEGFDVAVSMIQDSSNLDLQVKGTNLLAIFAKSLAIKVKYRKIDLDAENTKLLLSKFETQDYLITPPMVSQFIKLMNYTCMGDYSHIYTRFKASKFYKPVLIGIVLYLILVVLNASGRLKRKYKRAFNRFAITTFLMAVILFLLFKLSCASNIQEYSFYGFTA